MEQSLAAILFADIEGYSALMQKDISASERQLDKFRQVVQDTMQDYGGEVLSFYGDGVLGKLDTLADAIRSATQMQVAPYLKPIEDDARFQEMVKPRK